MAFPSRDVLGVVAADRFSARAGLDRLAVDAGGASGMPRLLLLADAVAQDGVDLLQGAVVPPLIEVAPGGALGRVAQLATSVEHVQEGIGDVAQVGLAGSSPGVHGDRGFEERPLLIGHVAGVALGSHDPFYASTTLYGTDSYRPLKPACQAQLSHPQFGAASVVVATAEKADAGVTFRRSCITRPTAKALQSWRPPRWLLVMHHAPRPVPLCRPQPEADQQLLGQRQHQQEPVDPLRPGEPRLPRRVAVPLALAVAE